MDQLLTVEDLARALGLSTHTIYQRRYRGDSLPRSITLGNNTIRFRASDCEKWLEEHADPISEPA